MHSAGLGNPFLALSACMCGRQGAPASHLQSCSRALGYTEVVYSGQLMQRVRLSAENFPVAHVAQEVVADWVDIVPKGQFAQGAEPVALL